MLADDKRRERWQRLIEEYKSSGETQGTFCQRNRLCLGTFKGWLYQYHRKKTDEAAGMPSMLPVRVTSTAEASNGSKVVFFFSNGTCLQFDVSVAPSTIGSLVEVLSRNMSC